MACIERTKFYENFNKFEYVVKIKSVIKGRHSSTEKETFELLEVTSEPDNKTDKKAFRVNPIMPSCATYGHVPSPLNLAFHRTCKLSDEVRAAYEIWW
jgi:hypothetical protein